MLVELEWIKNSDSSFDIAYKNGRKCWFELHMALHLFFFIPFEAWQLAQALPSKTASYEDY